MQEKKEKGTFLTNPPTREIRLTTSPSLRARHALSKKCLDIVGNAHKFNKQ